MSIFSNMLKSSESLFKNEIALDYSFVPKIIPYREPNQRYIATCFRPLFNQQSGKNLLVHGPSGVGKTVATKNLLQELEEESEEIHTIYVNCWQKNTTYKILLDVCDTLGYKLTMNKKTDELWRIIKTIVNKKSAVFVFDEADKLEDFDFLYMILEDVYRKSVVLITNYYEWLVDLDPRIKSRLTPDSIEFQAYNSEETRGILEKRKSLAFHEDVWQDDAFQIIAKKSADTGDVRAGLYLLKESAAIAESLASKVITKEHAEKAIAKFDDFTIKNTDDLDIESRKILYIVKANSGQKIGDLYETYKTEGGKMVYKTFQRKINKLAQNKFLTLTKVTGGTEGNSNIVKYISEARKEKDLTDY